MKYTKDMLKVDIEYYKQFDLKEYDTKNFISMVLKCGNSMTLKEIEEVLR